MKIKIAKRISEKQEEIRRKKIISLNLKKVINDNTLNAEHYLKKECSIF